MKIKRLIKVVCLIFILVGTFLILPSASAWAVENASLNGEINERFRAATPTVNQLITKDLSPTITGTNGLNSSQPAGESLTVAVNGAIYNVTPANNGKWSVNTGTATPASGTLGTFSNGQYEVTATVTDGLGATTSDLTTNELTIDTILPDYPLITFMVTSDNSPIIKGTWDHIDGVYIQVNVNGTVYKLGQHPELTIDGSGNWTVDLSAITLADGEYNIEVLTRDAAGNNRTDTTRGELIIDTTSPSVAILNAPTAVNSTNSFLVTIQFDENVTAFSIADIAVVNAGKSSFTPIDGSTYRVAITPTAAGNITINIPAGIAQDVVGNLNVAANEVVVIYDIVDPAIPTVNSLSTNDVTPVLSGTNGLGSSQPVEETVTLLVNGATFALNPLNNGTWTLDLSSAVPIAGVLGTFADGNSYEVVVTVTDHAGNESIDATNDELVIDTTEPIIPTITFKTTSDATPNITGTAEAFSEISMLLNGVNFATTVGAGGNWSINTQTATATSGGPFTALADGIYNIVVISTDAAGNAAADVTNNELTIDATGPTSPIVAITYVNNTSPIISGENGLGSTQPATETLSVSVNGATYEPTPDSNGLWSIATGTDVPTSGVLGVFSEGMYEIVASVTDGAANTATDGTTNELTIDLTPPTVPVVNTLLTNDQTPVITGTAEANSFINLTLNSVVFDVKTNASGNWSVNTGVLSPTTGGPFSNLADATYEISVISEDLAGNTNTDGSTNELTIDTTLPATPTVDLLTTNDLTPEITGTNGLGAAQPAGETLFVTVNGAMYTTIADGSGIWSVDTQSAVPTSGVLGTFSDGSYPVIAKVIDGAGNTTIDATTNELVIDTTPPEIPTIDFLTTNETEPELTGTADIGTTVRVNVNGVFFETIATVEGTWSVNTATDIPVASGPFVALTDGIYNVVVSSTDEVGNQTFDDTSNQLTIDTEIPPVPTINLLTTNDPSPIITGTAEAASKVVVSIAGVSFSTTTNGSGNWSLNSQTDIPVSGGPFAELIDGTYDVIAVSTDAAGNSNTDVTVDELIIDQTAPSQPTIDPLLTNNTLPTLTGTNGTAAALPIDEIFTVSLNGASYQVIPNTGGQWSLDLSSATPLSGTLGVFAEGQYEVIAQIADEAGNTSQDNTVNELSIDLTAPSVPTIDVLITNDVNPVISGAAEASTVLNITLNTVSFQTIATASGLWSLNTETASATAGGPFVDLAEGVYDVQVESVDAAGNEAVDTSTDELTVDTTAPIIPTVNFLATNNSSPTIDGLAEANTSLSISFEGYEYVVTIDGSANWLLDLMTATPDAGGPFTALLDGTYDIALVSADAAGNTVSDTTVNEITIDTEAPEVPTVELLGSSDGLPELTGSWDEVDANSLLVNVDGLDYVFGTDAQLSTNGTGDWTLDLSGLAIPLADGTYEVLVTTTDRVGNVAVDTTTNELIVNKSVINIPTVNEQTSVDGLPIITGTWDSSNASDLSVLINSITYVLGIDSELSTDLNGAWELDLSNLAVALGNGEYDIEVTAYNNVSSVSDATTNELTVAIPVISIPTVNVLENNDGLPVITGTWDHINTSILVIVVDNVSYSLSAGTVLTVDGSGNWTLDLSNLATPLASGVYDVEVTASDSQGNSAIDNTTNELTVAIPVLGIPTVNATESIDGLPIITGTWDQANAISLQITVNNVLYTLAESAELSTQAEEWILNLTQLPNPLLNGVYEVEALTSNASQTTSDVTQNELLVNNPEQDLDEDHVFDVDEDINENGNFDDDDSDGDGVPNYLDVDDDGDQVPTVEEDYDNDGNPQNEDTDEDGIPDYLDTDDDGDGLTTLEEDVDNNGDPRNDDTDEDGIPDYLDATDDSVNKADLLLGMVVSAPPYLIEQEITFSIVVTNKGPNVATGVEVEALLPKELLFVNAESSKGAYNEITGVWNIETMDVDAIDTLSLTALILEKGMIEYTAIAAGNEQDEDLDNNEAIVVIEVMEEFKISSGFSPNGDGINDTWQIDGIDLFPDNQVKVFNRWGNEVFSVTAYENNSNNWDGSNQGGLSASNAIVPDGTYFYVIELSNDLPKVTGYITVKQ